MLITFYIRINAYSTNYSQIVTINNNTSSSSSSSSSDLRLITTFRSQFLNSKYSIRLNTEISVSPQHKL